MKRFLLALLRVAERPAPPPGSSSELRIFRASKRYLYYLMAQWGLKQVGAFVGIVFSLGLFGTIKWGPFRNFSLEEVIGTEELSVGLVGVRIEMPILDLIGLLEIFAIGSFLLQLVISGLFIKLGWEMRWYMVSDTTLRLREGLWGVKEQTMTIANIQNMSVQQGPLQRLFGFADLRVTTAGGAGSQMEADAGIGKNMHVGFFRGIEDAYALRDSIQTDLSKHRDAGLGNPDEIGLPFGDQIDAEPAATESVPLNVSSEAVLAARAMAEESRRLRLAASSL